MSATDRFCGECGWRAVSTGTPTTSDTSTAVGGGTPARRPSIRWSVPAVVSLIGSLLVLGSIAIPWQYQEFKGMISVANDLRGDGLAYLLSICAVVGAVTIALGRLSGWPSRRRWLSFVPIGAGVASIGLVLVDGLLGTSYGALGTFQTSRGDFINQLGPGPLVAAAGGAVAAVGAVWERRSADREANGVRERA